MVLTRRRTGIVTQLTRGIHIDGTIAVMMILQMTGGIVGGATEGFEGFASAEVDGVVEVGPGDAVFIFVVGGHGVVRVDVVAYLFMCMNFNYVFYYLQFNSYLFCPTPRLVDQVNMRREQGGARG